MQTLRRLLHRPFAEPPRGPRPTFAWGGRRSIDVGGIVLWLHLSDAHMVRLDITMLVPGKRGGLVEVRMCWLKVVVPVRMRVVRRTQARLFLDLIWI